MTGYGSAYAQSDVAEVEVNVRSVNGRFLEVRVHLPREYLPFEGDVRKLAAQKVQRGSVDVFVLRRPGRRERSASVRTEAELAKKWLKAVRQLGTEVELGGEPTLPMLLSIPDVVRIEERSAINDSEGELLSGALTKALDICVRERVREGKALKKVLSGQVSKLSQVVGQIAKMRAEANQRLRARYEERLRKLGYPGDVEPQRLAQELVMQLDRLDITEEIHRLHEHLRAYKELLALSAAQGKKLDFYTQELLREVNTIGSKAQWAELTHLVVEAKSIIEQMREQVQNVE